jgi:hypothetical protein
MYLVPTEVFTHRLVHLARQKEEGAQGGVDNYFFKLWWASINQEW